MRWQLVRKERLELSRVTPLAPKTSASANSATFADKTITLFSITRVQIKMMNLLSEIIRP